MEETVSVTLTMKNAETRARCAFVHVNLPFVLVTEYKRTLRVKVRVKSKWEVRG